MAKTSSQSPEVFAANLRSLVTTPEVLRLVGDITTCTVEWEDQPASHEIEPSRGLELFPCFTLHLQRHRMKVKGFIYPNLPQEGDGVSHLIQLDLADTPFFLRLKTSQATFLLSPFHCRFLSILFGRLVLHHLSLTSEGKEGLLPYTPYSLEEQVVAGYLQSLEWAPCATLKLDAQDNPYIGSLLHTGADLRRCEIPGGGREDAIIRAWRLFKSLLYYSIEGERLFTGFAMMSTARPLEYYQQRWPSMLLYHEASHVSLEEGAQSLKQFLLNADGRRTFLALYGSQIVGLLQLDQGTHSQLATVKAWRSVLPLATISHKGRISFWIALKGRKKRRVPLSLSLLEYRHGHLHIPLFQDIFWQELERQLREVCPLCDRAETLPQLKALLEMIRRSGHGAILLLGLTTAQMDTHDAHLENQVRLAQPVPLKEPWLQHLLGLAKSDGALIFNTFLEACQFRARLKAPAMCLLPEKDDLGSGMRHQVTREFSAWRPGVLGICVSQDGHISLYRHGKLVSRLY